VRDVFNPVTPQMAIISAGDENPYDHANPALLEGLNRGKIPLPPPIGAAP
jgi:beta-lactamase superfamily II metal-dependent hydrolase